MGSSPASAQTASLTLASVPFSKDGYEYRCEVTNGNACDTKNGDATLNVNADNRITSTILNAEACVGGSFTYTVDYKNTTTACIWEYDDGSGYIDASGLGTVTPGPTSSTLEVTSATLAMDTDSWKFRARVQRAGGYVDNLSNIATVKVYEQIAFTPIADATLCPTIGGSFNVNITAGSGDLSYEWTRVISGDVLGSLSSLALSDLESVDEQYNVKVSHSLCPDVEQKFTISHHPDLVLAPLTHTSPLCIDADINLSAILTEGPALSATYAWTKDGGSVGSDDPLYGVLGSVTTAGSSIYKVVVTDHCTSKTSSIPIRVLDAITLTAVDPVQTICEGESVDLQVNSTGDNLVYNWSKISALGGAITVANLSSDEDYHIDALSTIGANYYRCVLSSTPNCTQPVQEFTVHVGEDIKVAVLDPITVCEGTGTSEFKVTIASGTPLSYQWYDNGGIMGTETNASLFVDNLLANNGHNYHCVVSGACKFAESNATLFTVNEDVRITTQPVDVSVSDVATDPISFSVEATGTGLNYQWWKNGSDMGAVNASAQTKTLTILSTDFNSGDSYYCVISSDVSCNGETSSTATLTISITDKITSQPTNTEICEGSSFTFEVKYKSAAVGVWVYDDDNDDNYDPIPILVGTAVVTDDLTYKTNVLTVLNADTGMNIYKFKLIIDGGPEESSVAEVKVYDKVLFDDISDEILCIGSGKNITVNVTAGTEPLSYEWSEGARDLGTNSSLNLDAGAALNGTYSLSITTNALCPTVTKNFDISHHPDLVFPDLAHTSPLCIGNPINLDATASSFAPGLNYKWTRDATDLGPNSTLDVTPGVSGIYKVVVADDCTSKTSSVSINVLDAITLVAVTPVQTICEGEAVDLQVNSTGDNLSYDWYKIDALLGAKVGVSLSSDEDYHIDALSTTGVNYYRCVLSSTPDCTQPVQEFTVNVQKNVTVSDPIAIVICQDELPASEFSVTASGEGPYTYQWYDNGVSMGGTETAASLSVNNVIENNGHNYHCVVGGTCKPAESNKALFTVNENVTIISHPVNQTIDEMGSATFTVTATGSGLTYQWYVNGVTMGSTPASAQTKTLSLTSVPLANNGNTYYCVVSGTCVDATSNTATLTVIKENRILVQAEPAVVCDQKPFTFEVQYKNTTTSCDWEYDDDNDGNYDPIGALGSAPFLATSSTLTVTTATDAMNSWKFRAVVKRTGFEVNNSNDVSVRVDMPASFDPIANVQICNGDGASFAVSGLTGSTPNTYQWTRGANNIGDDLGDNSSLNLIAAIATDATYSVGVTAGVCLATVKTFDISHYDDLALNNLIHANELCPTDDINLSATLTIGAAPALGVTYSWTKDDGDLAITTATYNKANITDDESGLYKVTVEDQCMIQSKSIQIDVLDIITKVSPQWTNKPLCVGDALLFEAQVAGDNPTYIWKVPTGVTDPGNVATFTVDAVTETNEGLYECSVQGPCGLAVVYTASVVVDDVPNITTDLDLTAVCVNEPLNLGPITYDATRGESIIWKFDDVVKPAETAPNLDLANADLIEEGNYRVEVTNSCGTDFSIGFQDVHPDPTLDPIADQIACQGENIIFRAVTTGENLTYRWFLDGAPQAAFDDKAELEIANVLSGSLSTSRVYEVECRVSSCGENLNKFASVTVNPNTILNKSLKGEVVYVGTDHEFDLDVTGGNLVFEWHHINTADEDNEIPSANTKTLTIDNLSLADAGEYYCKITGDCGIRFTSGYLTVKDPMRIVDGLGGDAIEKCFGEPLNLNISIEGEVFSINWFKGTDDLNHHELNYSIPALDLADAGTYRCVIVGEAFNNSETVNVTVYKTTVLNSDLKDKTLCENENLSWTPDVVGSELIYDWKFNTTNVSTEKILNILNLPMTAAGIYSVDITGKCGNVSSEANLSLNKLPEFISTSEDLEKCENDDEAIFTVDFIGDNLVYQWQKDNINITEANSTELKIQNLRTADAGAYKCVVNSPCGIAIESTEMNLVVIPQLKILSESPDMEICNGENAQFLVEVEGTNEVYQWQKDGVDISGEKAPQLTIGPASITEDGYYSCELSDKCTAKRYSNSKKLTVNALPSSQIFGRMTLCVLEDRVAYSTTVQSNINYGWLVEGGDFTTPTEDVVKTKITWGDTDLNGMVKLKILDEATGCYSQVNSLVTLRPLPDVKLTTLETRGICESEFDLSGGFPTGGIYWINGVSQNTFDPSQGNGEYQVRYSFTDDLGCSNSTGEMVMKIDSLPKVEIIDDVLVGSCETRLLSAETEENNIKWSPSRYLDDPNSATPTFTAGETTLYVATVVDKFGCVGNDIVNVTVAPLPTITTISDTIIGECKEIELTTHISGDVDEINWTNPSDLDNAKDSNPKLIERHLGVNDYQINVTDKYGCVGSASIKVEVLPNPEVGENQFLCEGETMLIDTKNLSNPVWSDGYTAWERTIDEPGEYELSVEQNDCKLEQKIVMNPLPKFELDNTIQPGIVIFEGETLTLDPELDPDYGPYIYDWSDGSVLPQLVVSESGTYKLSVEDNIGCIATDTVKVEVKPIGIESPNAFTPLSNNENDHFYLKDINVIDKFEMYIYNRWGELMYKTTEPGYANGWDGTYKGEDCPVGAYVWVVMLDGEIKEKGTVILVR
ncbi:gliding motility-associated C-terminal domain-containing protein [Ancylomarina sp.]|uniref:T9SS type B sorting domain-containing protein n=1 Tax=Ancylomarina sp. TaxID=1970196 RepID=UPI0035659E5F